MTEIPGPDKAFTIDRAQVPEPTYGDPLTRTTWGAVVTTCGILTRREGSHDVRAYDPYLDFTDAIEDGMSSDTVVGRMVEVPVRVGAFEGVADVSMTDDDFVDRAGETGGGGDR